MTDYSSTEYLKLAIFYASFLYFPAAALLLFVLRKARGAGRALTASALAALSCLAYARFVEPRVLLVREHDIALERCFAHEGSLRLAVFSDTHNGLFANAIPVARIARAVRRARADAVLIAGDFTYFLHPLRFTETFAALGAVGAPVYGVLGNHDVGLPGPDVGAPLKASLAGIGVIDIENRAETALLPGGTVEFAGLSDSWHRRQVMKVTEAPSEVPRILLTHNPETLYRLKPEAVVDLLVAGHTHGGQIRLPGLTCALIEMACSPHREGFRRYERADVFITAGTGMVGLPMRFLVPPRVDVLNVRYRACAGE